MATEVKPLKIASMIFGSLTRVGGYQVFTYNLLERLARRGNDVTLYVAREEYTQHSSFYQRLLFAVRPLFFRTRTLARYFPRGLELFLSYQHAVNRYDVWQIVGSYPAGYLASSLSGKVPLVLRTHGDDLQRETDLSYGLRLDPRLDRMIRHTAHKMDRVVAMTETMADCYREMNVPDTKIVEIPNGVDTRRFRVASDKMKTRRMWNIPEDRPLLLTVGRNHRKKGFSAIPEVAQSLKSRGVPFFWLVIGHETELLDPLITQAGVSDVVRTEREIGISRGSDNGAEPPSVPDERLIQLYQCADVFLYPSHLEGFPRVIIEAMAAGVPVVTTDAPGCRDVVRHGHTGLLAKPNDIEGFSTHIQSLIEDSALRHRLIERGVQHCQRYDWDVVVDSYEGLYRSLIE